MECRWKRGLEGNGGNKREEETRIREKVVGSFIEKKRDRGKGYKKGGKRDGRGEDRDIKKEGKKTEGREGDKKKRGKRDRK